MNIRILGSLFAIYLASVTAASASALNIDVSEFKLANGLDVVVLPDHRAPVVTHMIWYKVGAADEPKGQAGIAHFLEHLMFKGTAKHPQGEFSRLVRANGGEENAFTTQDYTAFYQRIAKDRLGMVMELEADRMQNLVLTDENTIPELQVVLEERRQRTDDSPSALLTEQLDAALYTAHPYGKPVIGWMPEVAKLTREQALDFYKAHYEPANAVLVVAGDVTADEVKTLAEKYYGGLTNPVPPPPRVRTPEPDPIAERRVIMHDERTASPYWQRTYLAPAEGKAEGRQAQALDVLSDILGAGSRGRLYKKLVVEQQLAAFTGAWYSGDALDYGDFGVYASPNPGVDPAKLEAAIDDILADVVANGVTQAELDTTRNNDIAQSVYLLDQQQSLARMFGTALMTGETVDSVLHWDDRLAEVTLQDVKDAAKAVLDTRRSVTGLLLPSGKVESAGAIEPEPILTGASQN